ncbi:MAG: hypothetical protein KKA05_06035, partial [Alphaproteobacteria bacterium]|nr:hypothetical protein [Alphaproteobacteria bacterium]
MLATKPIAPPPPDTLAAAMTMDSFQSVPTLILDTDALPDDAALIQTHISQMISDNYDGQAQDQLQQLFDMTHNVICTKVSHDRQNYGQIMSNVLRTGAQGATLFADGCDPAAYQPLHASIIFAPGQDFTAHDLLRHGGILADPTIMPEDNTALRYWVLHHELAHVAG